MPFSFSLFFQMQEIENPWFLQDIGTNYSIVYLDIRKRSGLVFGVHSTTSSWNEICENKLKEKLMEDFAIWSARVSPATFMSTFMPNWGLLFLSIHYWPGWTGTGYLHLLARGLLVAILNSRNVRSGIYYFQPS
jgi:hypothetical protein